MTNEEAIKYLKQLYPNGGHCWLDEQRIEAIGMAVNALQEEPVSDELEKVVEEIVDPTVLNAYGAKDIANRLRRTMIESVSEEWIDVAKQYVKEHVIGIDKFTFSIATDMFISGAKLQKENLWKPADGDNLPEIDREVVVLFDNGKVGFAHRPPEYWDGKNIITGKVTRNYPKTYDKGGWNIPDVKFWLDVELPKEIEL